MTKIVILVQNTVCPEYSDIDELSKTTWSKIPHPDVTVIHYYGGYNSDGSKISTLGNIPEKNEVSFNVIDGNNILVCGTTDVVGQTDPRAEKLILAYEWCLKNLEFDYIVRICNTTYIDIHKLHKFLHSLERKERQYDGKRNLVVQDSTEPCVPVHPYRTDYAYPFCHAYPFCNGYFTYMSRDCTEQLVAHREDYLSDPIKINLEDVQVGYILMYKLNYAYWDEPHNITFCSVAENDGKITSYIEYDPTDNFNAYRFRKHTTDEYIQFHNKVLEHYKKTLDI